jgi:hypothetical protein
MLSCLAGGEVLDAPLPRPVTLHTLTFDPYSPDETRFAVTAAAVEILAAFDGGGVLALPAGAFRSPSPEAAHGVAERMAELSRARDVSLLFGVDLLPPAGWAPLSGPIESLAFACRNGEPVLWPAARLPLGRNEGTAPIEAITARHLRLGGARLGLVLAGEVFNVRLRRMLARRHPDAIVVLTHGGVGERWHLALEALAAVAPVILTGQAPAHESPGWAEPPPGWVATRVADTDSTVITRYAPSEPPP